MKNIGIFTHDLYPFKPWGQGRYVFDLVNHLRPQCRRKIYVFSPAETNDDPYHVAIFPGSYSSIGKNISFSVKLNFIIERLIKKYNLGLCHFQGGPGGLFLLKKLSVPALYTVHHTFFQQISFLPSQKWKKVLFFVEKYSYYKSDAFFCDSNSTYGYLVDQYQIDERKCKTIPIGVDRNSFYEMLSKIIPNSIFFLGRLEKRKGVEFLVKSIVIAKEKIPDIQLFVGGKGKLERKLKKYVNDNNLIGNVHFLDTVNDSELNYWYNKISLVVIPSVFEGFGLIAIEAMASGTPVIATEVDGLKDIVSDGLNGRLVPYGDVEVLSSTIIELLTNSSLCEEFVLNGLRQVEDVYNWKQISRQVLAEYECIIDAWQLEN